jgi:hypothetical protein
MSDNYSAVDKSLDLYIDVVLDEVAAELKRIGIPDRDVPATPEARATFEQMRDDGVPIHVAALAIMDEYLGVRHSSGTAAQDGFARLDEFSRN